MPSLGRSDPWGIRAHAGGCITQDARARIMENSVVEIKHEVAQMERVKGVPLPLKPHIRVMHEDVSRDPQRREGGGAVFMGREPAALIVENTEDQVNVRGRHPRGGREESKFARGGHVPDTRFRHDPKPPDVRIFILLRNGRIECT